MIACLEKGLVSEVEEQAGHYAIKEECKKAIIRVAELSSDDFHLDRHLYFACRDDRERFCEKVRFSFRTRTFVSECLLILKTLGHLPYSSLYFRLQQEKEGSTNVSSTTSLRTLCLERYLECLIFY